MPRCGSVLEESHCNISLLSSGEFVHCSTSESCYLCFAGIRPDPVSSGVPGPEPQLTTELYTVPSHSTWFRYTAIHEIERKSVPDFFDGRSTSKTPKVSLLSMLGFQGCPSFGTASDHLYGHACGVHMHTCSALSVPLCQDYNSLVIAHCRCAHTKCCNRCTSWFHNS